MCPASTEVNQFQQLPEASTTFQRQLAATGSVAMRLSKRKRQHPAFRGLRNASMAYERYQETSRN